MFLFMLPLILPLKISKNGINVENIRIGYALRKRFFFFLKRRYFKKLSRFIKRYKRRRLRLVNKVFYRLFNQPYVFFLIKKLFFSKKKPYNSFFPYHFRRRVRLSRFIFRPLALVPTVQYISTNRQFLNFNKSIFLLFLSTLDAFKNNKSFKKDTTNKNFFSNLTVSNFFFKHYLRSALKQSFLSAWRLLKTVWLFSKKGNTNSLFNFFSKEVYNSRFGLFKSISNSKIFLPFESKNQFIFTKRDNKISFSYFLLSLFVKSILGLVFKLKVDSNPLFSVVKKQFLFKRYSKVFFVRSSFRLLSLLFKPFYSFIDIKPWKKSGRSIIVPVPIKSRNRRIFAFSHWIKDSSLKRSDKQFSIKLMGELSDVSLRQGLTINKLNVLLKTIRSNRALIRKSKISLV